MTHEFREKVLLAAITAMLGVVGTLLVSHLNRRQSLSDVQRHKAEDLAQSLESFEHVLDEKDFQLSGGYADKFVERVDRHEFETAALPRFLADELQTLRMQSADYAAAAKTEFQTCPYHKDMLGVLLRQNISLVDLHIRILLTIILEHGRANHLWRTDLMLCK
jgi:UDP-N-acetylmuramyl pentapeptide synthase